MNNPTTEHHVVIEPKSGWQVINFKELREYRDLFRLMVLRDITVLYKQTVLGFAWAIINPLLTMVIFTLVFSKIAGIKTGEIPYPLFSFAGLLPWTYFSQSLISSSGSLVTNAQLINKVYFPRLIIPLTPVFAKLADFGIAFIILLIMIFAYGFSPNINVLWLPLLLAIMILTAGGLGMWLSALAIQFRDIKFAVSYLIQMLLYAAPIAWPASAIAPEWRPFYGLYPMVGVVEGFRASLIGTTPMPWDLILPGILMSIVFFITGALYFKRMEKVFADLA